MSLFHALSMCRTGKSMSFKFLIPSLLILLIDLKHADTTSYMYFLDVSDNCQDLFSFTKDKMSNDPSKLLISFFYFFFPEECQTHHQKLFTELQYTACSCIVTLHHAPGSLYSSLHISSESQEHKNRLLHLLCLP